MGRNKKRNKVNVDWVLKAAGGKCELCGCSPFRKDDGSVYLEVHHVIPMSRGGDDVVTNMMAVCPNCHRALHYSVDRKWMSDVAYSKVSRLSRTALGDDYHNLQKTGLGRRSKKVLDWLDERGGSATTTEIARKFGGVSGDRVGTIEELTEQGLIEVVRIEGRGRPTMLVRVVESE